MRNTAISTLIIVLILSAAIPLFLSTSALSQNAEAPDTKLLKDFTGAAKDSINPEDLKQLSGSVSKLYEKYKFDDKDIEELCASSVNLVLSISTFSDALGSSSDGNVEIPKNDVNDFFTTLGSFLGKYKVTAGDTLGLGRDVAQVAMGAQQKLKGNSQGVTKEPSISKENMDKIFSKLIDFSTKHNIQAQDLTPILNNLADIGLTVTKEQIMSKSGKSSTGISKPQVMNLIGSLMAFQKKYKIDLFEVIQLGDEIRKITQNKQN